MRCECSFDIDESNHANGNMTHDGVNELTFDAENHAVTSADGSGTASYSEHARAENIRRNDDGLYLLGKQSPR